jgi:uncharacterized membrane protein YidH (DUF202 family)
MSLQGQICDLLERIQFAAGVGIERMLFSLEDAIKVKASLAYRRTGEIVYSGKIVMILFGRSLASLGTTRQTCSPWA